MNGSKLILNFLYRLGSNLTRGQKQIIWNGLKRNLLISVQGEKRKILILVFIIAIKQDKN